MDCVVGDKEQESSVKIFGPLIRRESWPQFTFFNCVGKIAVSLCLRI